MSGNGDTDNAHEDEGIQALVDLDRCIALRRNPQYLTPHEMEALKLSIKRDGFLVPITLRPMDDETDYTYEIDSARGGLVAIGPGKFEIVAGNHRVMAAREVGMRRVPGLIKGLTDEQRQRFAVNSNTVHGEPRAELLAPFLAEIDDHVLATVHLSEQMLAEVTNLDGELQARLAALEAPDAWDTDSPKNVTDTCDCPKCGRRHVVAQLP